MPMYFPDLESVKHCAEMMARNKGDKRYEGLIPKTEAELPRAREELAEYFRRVWGDKVQALEIECAVSKDNYEAEMRKGVLLSLLEEK